MTSRSCGSPPEPGDGPFAIERLTTLAHELGNLLDGSMRCLGLARRSLAAAKAGSDDAQRAQRQLDTVQTALEQMADLVNAAMQGSASVIGSPTLNPRRPITILEAAGHAMDVLTPEADEHNITLSLEVLRDAEQIAAGPLYSVLLNGLRNAIESIARSSRQIQRNIDGFQIGGHVDVRISAQPVPGAEVDLLMIEISDDGAGVNSRQGVEAFDLGVSSKPGSLGVGLALAREVVRQVGGSIDLYTPPERIGRDRPGAVLKVVFPMVRRKVQANP